MTDTPECPELDEDAHEVTEREETRQLLLSVARDYELSAYACDTPALAQFRVSRTATADKLRALATTFEAASSFGEPVSQEAPYDWEGSYTMLRDALEEHLGAFISDGEEAEEYLYVQGIERIANHLAHVTAKAFGGGIPRTENEPRAKLDVSPGTQVGEFHWQDGWTIRREGMRIRIRKYRDATCRVVVDDTYIDFDDWVSIMEAACGEPSAARRRYLTALCIVDGWAEGALRASVISSAGPLTEHERAAVERRRNAAEHSDDAVMELVEIIDRLSASAPSPEDKGSRC